MGVRIVEFGVCEAANFGGLVRCLRDAHAHFHSPKVAVSPAHHKQARHIAARVDGRAPICFVANRELALCQLCARRDQSMITGRATRSRAPKEQVEYLFVPNGRKSRRPVQVLGRLALGRSQFGQMRELINNGLGLLNVPIEMQLIAKGLIIIAALAVSNRDNGS